MLQIIMDSVEANIKKKSENLSECLQTVWVLLLLIHGVVTVEIYTTPAFGGKYTVFLWSG